MSKEQKITVTIFATVRKFRTVQAGDIDKE